MTLHYNDLTTHDDPAKIDLFTLPQAVAPYAKPSFGLYRDIAKRIADLALLIAFAPIFVPLILLLALAVWAKTGAQPFYTQARVGKDGKSFTMWKLRTMVVDADERLEEYLASNPAARAEWDLHQKLTNDPRITRFGRLLRKTSLDELPQLWNVFVGEMSLVGPRPMMESQKELYPGLDYYDLRPGLTGLWQVSERNETSFAQRAWFDSQYNRELSPLNDAMILLGTFGVIFRCTGR